MRYWECALRMCECVNALVRFKNVLMCECVSALVFSQTLLRHRRRVYRACGNIMIM